MEEIKAIIEREDIAATVVLHDVIREGGTEAHGFRETFVKVDPSYSCVFFERHGSETMLRIRSKLVDFNGDQNAQQKKVSETANMLMHLAQGSGDHALNFLNLLDIIDDKVAIAEIGDEGESFSSHEQQNN